MNEGQSENNNSKTKCETFNGDTPTGRTKWQQWLRDIQLILDDWSWAVMTNAVIDHETFNKYLEQKAENKLKESKCKKLDEMYDMAAKSTAATKGKKSVQEWKKEMQTDHEAFRTFLCHTEKYILLLLQRHTEGEAKAQVSGIQIDPICGRQAFSDLARIYGRSKEEDTDKLINRLRGGLTIQVSENEYRAFGEGDNVNVHIRVLETLRRLLTAMLDTINKAIVEFVRQMLSDSVMEHTLRQSLPPTLRTEAARCDLEYVRWRMASCRGMGQ